MDGYLKQSTAANLKIGPFVDSTDGNTDEAGFTIEDEHVLLSKNGGALTAKNETTNCTYDANGYYLCPVDATDTGTLGRLQLSVHFAGALHVYHEYMVVTANVYDTLCSTDLFQTDLTQISGTAQSATDLKDLADTGYDPATHKVQGLVLCDTTTTNSDMVSSATIEAACDASLDNAIGGAPTAGSVAERVKALDDLIADSKLPAQVKGTDNIDFGALQKASITTAANAATNLANALKVLKNKWAYSGTTFTIYDDDGTTPLYTFTLDSATTPTSRTPT
jgi:hypothetical protein